MLSAAATLSGCAVDDDANTAVESVTTAVTTTPGLSESLLDKAVRAGDNLVVEAGEYNRAHVRVLTSSKEEARAALQTLAKVGDEFTLTWLTELESRRPELERQWIDAAADRIKSRLKAAPVSAAEVVPARLFRAAWADISCNALEAQLKGFVWEWAKKQKGDAAFRSELSKIVAEPVASSNEIGPMTVRERAQSYARMFLHQ